MYFIYSWDLGRLHKHQSFGDGECVALPQAVTNVGYTGFWRPGPRVVDLSLLNPGAVIANFMFDKKRGGYFPNKHGYHAALFVEFGASEVSSGKPISIKMVDQWRGRKPNLVMEREVLGRGKSYAEGNAYHDSENADQYFVMVYA
ncbi:BPSL0067 family protein [Massilia sp.]|uniref:BPSL0067 family protein n=1 Tax=Massilia sp. TaxID=1882437 RepID=UPI0028A6BF0F|nr:BPSL0067 family protein [Massilia sp.]